MHRLVFWLLLLFSTTLLMGQLNWQHTYFSGLLQDETLYIRTQAAANSLVSLLAKTATGVQTTAMENLNDGYNNHQVQVANPSYPYIGFRCTTGNTTEVLPVYYNGPAAPVVNDLTPLFSDPVGDCNFTFTNLDITASSASFSNDKLYFGITNASGGFPINSGLTYFAYLAALVNPDADSTANTIVYGLMHTVNINGIISPGLYKITGTGITDMTLIGQITTTTYASSNTLVLSCNMSDLLADTDFMTWYNPAEPKLGFIALTNRITLTSGSQVADQTSSCNIIPQPVMINQSTASIPSISDIMITTTLDENATQISLNFFSPESLLPVLTQIEFDTGFISNFYPTAFPDFNQTVPYETIINPDDIPNWTYATIRFSVDGMGFTNNMIYPTAANDFSGGTIPAVPFVSVFPNPSKGKFTIDIKSTHHPEKIEIYDIKGRKLNGIEMNSSLTENLLNYDINKSGGRSEGIYLLKIVFPDRSITRKLVFFR